MNLKTGSGSGLRHRIIGSAVREHEDMACALACKKHQKIKRKQVNKLSLVAVTQTWGSFHVPSGLAASRSPPLAGQTGTACRILAGCADGAAVQARDVSAVSRYGSTAAVTSICRRRGNTIESLAH